MYDVTVPCPYCTGLDDDGDPIRCEQDVPVTVEYEPGEPRTRSSPGYPGEWVVTTEHTCPMGHELSTDERATVDSDAIDAAMRKDAAFAEFIAMGGDRCP